MRLYGFFGKNPLDDVGHILIGLIPFWGWAREIRQLPPENDRYPVYAIWHGGERGVALDPDPSNIETARQAGADIYWAESRVMDAMGRDGLGYAIGDVIRTAALVAWGVLG